MLVKFIQAIIGSASRKPQTLIIQMILRILDCRKTLLKSFLGMLCNANFITVRCD
jgi:hypothetical protein